MISGSLIFAFLESKPEKFMTRDFFTWFPEIVFLQTDLKGQVTSNDLETKFLNSSHESRLNIFIFNWNYTNENFMLIFRTCNLDWPRLKIWPIPNLTPYDLTWGQIIVTIKVTLTLTYVCLRTDLILFVWFPFENRSSLRTFRYRRGSRDRDITIATCTNCIIFWSLLR